MSMWAYRLAVFGAAFLLFQIQPITSKAMLPAFGGSYLVWGATIVFYQAMLLAGYVYAHAMQRALGTAVAITRRPDGKPEAGDGSAVSAAHAGDLTLAVAGEAPLGCDLEPVISRPAPQWSDLLGTDRFALAKLLADENAEDPDAAATRVWAAAECLKKVGAPVSTPLLLEAVQSDHWVLLKGGAGIVATLVARVRGLQHSLVLAVLVGEKNEGL